MCVACVRCRRFGGYQAPAGRPPCAGIVAELHALRKLRSFTAPLAPPSSLLQKKGVEEEDAWLLGGGKGKGKGKGKAAKKGEASRTQ